MVFRVIASDLRMLHHWLARVLPAESSISSALSCCGALCSSVKGCLRQHLRTLTAGLLLQGHEAEKPGKLESSKR